MRSLRAAGLVGGAWVRDPLRPSRALCLTAGEDESAPELLEATWRHVSTAPAALDPRLLARLSERAVFELRDAAFDATAAAATTALAAMFTPVLSEVFLLALSGLAGLPAGEPLSGILLPASVLGLFVVSVVIFAGVSVRRLLFAVANYLNPAAEGPPPG